jgi:SAM-dependent methyltransferase
MNLYERYHLGRKLQKRVISNSDFTYRSILFFLNKYGKKSQKVLDIGCGVGTTSLFLGSSKKNVVGIDISKTGISVAKKNAEKLNLDKLVKFKVLDFPNKLPTGKFDLIICSEVLEHIKNDKMAVIRIENILQKGGIVIASSPSQDAPLYRVGLLKNFDKEVGHLRRYSEETFEGLFEDAGLKILETKKTEGVLRNFLFTNSFGGFLLRVLNKWPFSEVVTFVDNLTISIFGESNIYVVAQKK